MSYGGLLANSEIYVLSKTHLYLFHFIQVTISLIIYSILLFRHIKPGSYGATCVTDKNLVYHLARHESFIAQW